MRVEYLIKWKDGAADTWRAAPRAMHATRRLASRFCVNGNVKVRRLTKVISGLFREPARNVAEDILKDYESRWWNCARRVRHRP